MPNPLRPICPPLGLLAGFLCAISAASAQEPPPPPPPAEPEPDQPYAQPAPAPAAPAAPYVQPAPAPQQPQQPPQPQPPQPQYAAPQQPPQQQPPQQQPPPQQPPPQQQPYAQPYAQPAQSAPPPPPPRNEYGPPPPRPQPDGDRGGNGGEGGGGFEMPPFAVRIDPFNWLLHGRLGVEIEVGLVGPLTAELVPVFVTSESPAMLNLGSLDEELTQESNGLGAISGASLGVGIWLNGKPFSGYVLRAVFTNYGYRYSASDADGVFDRVTFTERRFVAYFGSNSRFGPFVIGGAIGLGYEFNQVERCGLTANGVAGGEVLADDDRDCKGQNRIALTRDASSEADLNGFAHPVYLEGRFSLGFAFD